MDTALEIRSWRRNYEQRSEGKQRCMLWLLGLVLSVGGYRYNVLDQKKNKGCCELCRRYDAENGTPIGTLSHYTGSSDSPPEAHIPPGWRSQNPIVSERWWLVKMGVR